MCCALLLLFYSTVFTISSLPSPPLISLSSIVILFFFQAEDGIRDRNVTGVQTCALPILTNQLLTNIFTPNTPLHDGAVIIKRNKIVAAACYLPLSESTAISKELGTRHR